MKKIYILLIALLTINIVNAQWTVLSSGTSQILASVFFSDANNGYICGSGGIILKTTNAGTTWTSKTSGLTTNLNSIYFTSSTTGYAVGDSKTIIKTTDGGTSWTILDTSTAYICNLYFRVG